MNTIHTHSKSRYKLADTLLFKTQVANLRHQTSQAFTRRMRRECRERFPAPPTPKETAS